jgi:MYXO-CTERM domain-containing protein
VETVFPEWKDTQFEQLRTAQFGSMQQFLEMAQSVAQSHFYPSFNGFGGPLGDSAVAFGANQYDGFMEVLTDPEIVPLREGATAEQLNTCVGCYFQVDVAVRNDAYPSTPFDPETDPILQMDVQAFLNKMEEFVIGPLRSTRAMFEDNSQVTRLYTTMSAEEMNLDPEFDLNPELEDVANVHTANRIFECNGNDWTIELPQGISLTGTGSTWPVSLDDDEMPFNMRILQLSTSGDGEVLLDNTDTVVSRLSDLGLTDIAPPDGPSGPSDVSIGDPTVDPDEEDPVVTDDEEDPSDPEAEDDEVIDAMDDEMAAKTSSDGGCAVQAPTKGSSAPWAFGLLALGWLAALRRRRVAGGE